MITTILLFPTDLSRSALLECVASFSLVKLVAQSKARKYLELLRSHWCILAIRILIKPGGKIIIILINPRYLVSSSERLVLKILVASVVRGSDIIIGTMVLAFLSVVPSVVRGYHDAAYEMVCDQIAERVDGFAIR